EGAQDLRCEIWGAVRGGADCPGRKGRIPEEERGRGACFPRRSEIGDAILPRKAARGPTASDRPQDGSRESRRLRGHERLLSRAELAGRRRRTRENAGLSDQGRVPEKTRRRQVAGRSQLSAKMRSPQTPAPMPLLEVTSLDKTFTVDN